ncbi:hypothetical protein UCMB321_2342 [Pseudomonas batumici]|uniref:Uncharacterized protein n=1 Tax=Pseudomonas batumici TaxID=226910 RepID=A0A0C2IAG5_9PSED|nr:hypothetical protein UCMB321_2342 [Pseudomonas batumici]
MSLGIHRRRLWNRWKASLETGGRRSKTITGIVDISRVDCPEPSVSPASPPGPSSGGVVRRCNNLPAASLSIL